MEIRDREFLIQAIEKAKESVEQGGFPAGAILVKNSEVIGSGISIGNLLNNPTGHAEIVSILEVCKKLKKTDLSGVVLYASMQPCLMCLGASMWASISKIVFACSKEKVSEEYYGGHYHVSAINKELIQPIELVHMADLEEKSLEVVRKWEVHLNEK